MSFVVIARLMAVSTLVLSGLVFATDSASQVDAGVTPAPMAAVPSTPIATAAQLDVYLRDTPAPLSSLNWLPVAARQRFLDSLVFTSRGLGGMSVDDLRYELTDKQAYGVLQLFGEQGYAMSLGARSQPRATSDNARQDTLDSAFGQLVDRYERSTGSHPDDAATTPADLYAKSFAPLQTDARRHALSTRDVELLFRAAHLLFAGTQQPGYLAHMRDDFAELRRRQRVERPAASDLYDSLVTARRTDDARQLLASFPVIERQSPPTMRSPQRIRDQQPSLWIATPRKRELVRLRFNMRSARQVIVLGSTGCHFSRAAADAIQADPLLSRIFEDYGQWVTPAEEVTRFDAVQAWNERYPDLRFGTAYDNAELSMVERFETPVFYFLEHGRVVDTVVGWPAEGNLEAIRAGLKKIDLL